MAKDDAVKPSSEVSIDVDEEDEYEFSSGVSRDSFREVGVGTMMTILHVDNVRQSMTISLVVHAVYQDSEHVKPLASSKDEFKLADKYAGFIPNISMERVSDSLYDHFIPTTFVNQHSGLVYSVLENSVTIRQNLDFRAFPFDRQVFPIRLQSLNSHLTVWKGDPKLLGFAYIHGEYEETRKNASHVLVGAPDHWNLLSSRVVQVFERQPHTSHVSKDYIQIVVKAERKPTYYGLRYCIVLFFIVLTNVVVFGIPATEVSDRNSISITLLLTLVAFKFVLQQDVPEVSYMTYMDYYVLVSFFFVVLAIFENLFISFVTDTESRDEIDFYWHIVYVGVWVLLNLMLFVFFLRPSLLRSKWEDVIIQEMETKFRAILVPEKITSFEVKSHFKPIDMREESELGSFN